MTLLAAAIGIPKLFAHNDRRRDVSFLANHRPALGDPSRVKSQAQVELAGGVPFISDADLESALDEAHVSSRSTDAALDAYRDARIDGLRSALAILAVLVIVALFFAQRIPKIQPGAAASHGGGT